MHIIHNPLCCLFFRNSGETTLQAPSSQPRTQQDCRKPSMQAMSPEWDKQPLPDRATQPTSDIMIIKEIRWLALVRRLASCQSEAEMFLDILHDPDRSAMSERQPPCSQARLEDYTWLPMTFATSAAKDFMGRLQTYRGHYSIWKATIISSLRTSASP
jgi:hypothetical protein